jgi:serine protease Do
VQIQPVDKDIAESLGLSEASGALVMSPQEGSPGAKAGIKKGDVVTAVNGETVKGPRELAKMIAAVRPGTDVDVSIWRDGKSQSVKVNIGTLPAEQKQASAEPATPDEQQQDETSLANLGISVAPAEDGNGLTITSVDPDSDAGDRGLKQGDRITTVNNQEVNSAKDIQAVLSAAKKDGRKKALFQIEADNGSRFVALPTDKG